jgi:hypothetical protein
MSQDDLHLNYLSESMRCWFPPSNSGLEAAALLREYACHDRLMTLILSLVMLTQALLTVSSSVFGKLG